MRASLGLVLSLACGACAATTAPYLTDSGPDGSLADAVTDGGLDVPPDRSSDVPLDVSIDAPVDVSIDAPVDAPVDVATDVSSDLPPLDAPDAAQGCGTVTPPSPTAPCPALCGNGRLDMCSMCHPCLPGGGGGGPPPLPDGGVCCTGSTEPCDGTNLGGATCASLGYVDGTLACAAWCGFDTTGCNACASGPHVTACTRAVADATGASSLALSASGANLAVAWVTGGSAHFSRFNDDLSRLGDTMCLGPAGAVRVALAATASGWLAAVEAGSATGVYLLSATGAPVGPVSVFPGAGHPLLAHRPAAGPLLVWTLSTGPVQDVVLSADGRPVTVTSTLFSSSVEAEYGSASAYGGGFMVAMRTSAGVEVIPVEADGRGGVSRRVGSETEYPQLADGGPWLTWADFGASPATVRGAAIDPVTGAMVGATVTVGAVPSYYNPCPAAILGDHIAVLLAGYTGGTGRAGRLDAVFFTPDSPVGTPFHVDQDPNNAISYRLATRGTDVVAAWLSTEVPGRIGLARLTP